MTVRVDTEVRCYCRARALLAKFGRDPSNGEPVIHIKSWKGDKLYVNVVVLSGVVNIQCRSCLKWHRVKIVRGAPRLQEQEDLSI